MKSKDEEQAQFMWPDNEGAEDETQETPEAGIEDRGAYEDDRRSLDHHATGANDEFDADAERTSLESDGSFQDEESVEPQESYAHGPGHFEEADVPLDQLGQPVGMRAHHQLQDLDSLAKSIEKVGLLEPIIVTPMKDGRYHLLAGTRRAFACKRVLGWSTIRARIFIPAATDYIGRSLAHRMTLVSNLEREDIDDLTFTHSVIALLAIDLRMDEDDVTGLLRRMHTTGGRILEEEETARHAVSVLDSINVKWFSFVSNQLPLLSIADDLQVAVRELGLEYTKAKALNPVKDPKLRAELLERAVEQNLSRVDIQDLVKGLLPERTRKVKPAKDPYKRSLQRVSETRRLLRQFEKQLTPELTEQIATTLERLIAKIEGSTTSPVAGPDDDGTNGPPPPVGDTDEDLPF